MKLSCVFSAAAAGVAAIFLMGASSCEEALANPDKFFNEEVDQTPSYVVSIHDMIKYQRGDMMEKELESFSGGTVCVNKNSYLHSRDIMKIGMVQRKSNPEFFDLIITLTDRGQKIWSALSVNMRAKGSSSELAFVIDGMYYRSFKPELLTDNETIIVTVEGPFDPATAKGLVKNSERNYKIFNK